MRTKSLAWSSIHLVALIHQEVGLSSAQSFELAQAMNITPNELDRMMGEAAALLNEVVGRAEILPDNPPPAPLPKAPRRKKESKDLYKRGKEVSELPFLKSTLPRETVVATRIYDPALVDGGSRSYYLALPRMQNLDTEALGKLERVVDTAMTRSMYILKVLRFGLYDPRMARAFASRKSAVLQILNNPRANALYDIPLPPHTPGVFPPTEPTPSSLWYALQPHIRDQILFRDDDGRGPNAFKEYLLLRMAYGYNARTAASVTGLTTGDVDNLYHHLGLR